MLTIFNFFRRLKMEITTSWNQLEGTMYELRGKSPYYKLEWQELRKC